MSRQGPLQAIAFCAFALTCMLNLQAQQIESYPTSVGYQLLDTDYAPEYTIEEYTVAPGAIRAGASQDSVIAASCGDSCDAGCETGCEAPCETSCEVSCNSCQRIVCCCPPWYRHRTGAFGELLYLAPASSDLIYAVEQTDPTATANPTGPLGRSNIDPHVGFRVGLAQALSDCSSLVVSYARWDGDTNSSITASPGTVLNSQLIHPSTATTGAASISATADQTINFQTVDAILRRVFKSTGCGVLNWNGGLRYGNLEQGLSADQTVAVATGLTNVTTDVDFNGWGIIFGLDGERKAQNSGLLVYGKVFGSLLAGNWQANYAQVNQFGGGIIANSYRDFRITPVVDTELGVGWLSKEGHLKLTTGYSFSTWFNSVNNRDYIQSVRTGNQLELHESVSFTGLTSRIEIRL
ncbi:MAG: Lpg1974 family pore-forming outer membrane protein [Planctomycetota bacterium]